jgi:hypothetical protein
MLYDKRCRTPVFGNKIGERQVFGPDTIRDIEKHVCIVRENLKVAQSHQKSYTYCRRRELSLKIGYFVYLNVSPTRGLGPFQVRGKLAPMFIAPFMILERKGEVAYHLELPPQVFVVHDVFHVS